ncbi:FAD linked oxidase [Macleaya cordata]|uniref:L-gulonolactone oxidase n=1 Tax=Macleaya cordata TaxID=56857 RepID=A0A200Q2S4_MACCD|nr:FAD linked oxidase [Macleaya cordata]
MVSCSPPDDPIKCSSKNSNCTITNSYGEFPDRTVCKASNVFYPTTEEELISVVAMASMNKTKVKVATRYSHSIPKLVCPDGQDGLLISTLYLNRTLKIDAPTMTMTVESGAMLRDVIEQAAKAGLALPAGPYWWGLTIGGLISTGAHGSSLWGNGSSVHDYVERLRIVTPAGPKEGYAKVWTLDNDHPHINAAKVSLGVLGVISQVTLRLEPMFKRSITYTTKNDSDLVVQAGSFGKEHEFADITWYPSQRKVVYRVDDRVPSNVSGNGLNNFVGFRSTLSLILAAIRSSEDNQESSSNANGKCRNAKLTTSTLWNTGFGYTNDGIAFTGYPIVGYQNRLQASGSCLDSPHDAQITACPWDHRVKSQFFHQTTISIGLSNVKNFIEDVQKLRDLEPKAFCGLELYNGILMRYVKASNAYLGKQQDAVDFDITYYRSKNSETPRLFEDVFEEVEQLALFKYGGIPHWGKNRNVAFIGAIKKYVNADEFLKVKKMYDPFGIFSSEWTDQVLGLKDGVTIVKEGCALEGLCICSEDVHCAPKKGYFCRPGRVYKDARVCTHLSNKLDSREVM